MQVIEHEEATRLNEHYVQVSLTQYTIAKGVRLFGSGAEKAVIGEIVQLFKTKKTLIPVKKKYLEKKHIMDKIRSSTFIKEKRDGDGKFEKLKGRLLADGRGQDKALYGNFLSPTALLDSIFLELQGVVMHRRKWMKIDIRGRIFKCALR